MSRKRKPGHYFCEVYRMNFYYFLGWPKDYMKKYMKDEHGIETTFDDVNGRMMFNKEKGIVVIWTKKRSDKNSLVHECVHAASVTLEDRGVVISHLNDEALAYLTEAIFRKSS